MKVFVTGASGFIGSAIVTELLRVGHQVTGLARSEISAAAVKEAGANVLNGSLDNIDSLKNGATVADAVIHTAFIHDFSNFAHAVETDRLAIQAIGEALQGTSKPFLVTAGLLGLPKIGGIITEASRSSGVPRASETEAMKLAEQGINVSVVRLPPSVHAAGDKGFFPVIIETARKTGKAGYPLDGNNKWPAIHRYDAARLYRLALEKSEPGSLYNAIGESGVTQKEIAELIADQLNLPLASISQDDLSKHFGWMAAFIGFDSPASSIITSEKLQWKPVEQGLLEDMNENYF